MPTVEFMASRDDNFNLKWRAYIEFRTILKIQPVQIFNELQEILCLDCPSRSTVERLAARFRSGDGDVTDLPRSGRQVHYCQSVITKYGDFIGSYSDNSDD
ncbi:hypothetical protein LOD99_11362 [Oopsacas minuta]|uniref:Uncharacterized protein n=1 Tax=Oopsacas minuta TaxID=111878 RepID=A0AAV7K5F3_9METZ|nr:hypothetical protein LOD99_11362 [Oopsacas minuta]